MEASLFAPDPGYASAFPEAKFFVHARLIAATRTRRGIGL
jgi:hypothetical protein